jgi:hypothetical protein
MLTLPAGWTFRVKKLDRNLTIAPPAPGKESLGQQSVETVVAIPVVFAATALLQVAKGRALRGENDALLTVNDEALT